MLAPGKRTVTQALRVMGLGEAPRFRRYHEVLDRARWDTRAAARQLLYVHFCKSRPIGEIIEIPTSLLNRVFQTFMLRSLNCEKSS